MIQAILQRWFREALHGGKLDRFLGKRSSMRCEWSVPLELRTDEAILAVEGRNFAPKGVGFWCGQSLAPDQVLAIRRPGEPDWIKIRIKHCSPTEDGFAVGAEFEQRPYPGDRTDQRKPEASLTAGASSPQDLRRKKRLHKSATDQRG